MPVQCHWGGRDQAQARWHKEQVRDTQACTMATWSTDLQAALQAQAANPALVLLAKGECVKEYATLTFAQVRDFTKSHPGVVLYEVVTEGKCYLHLYANNPDRDADVEGMYEEVKGALAEALPDVPVTDMRPARSAGILNGKATLKLVYKDIGLSGLAAARKIGEAVSEKLGASATKIDLDVYRHCYCHMLPTCNN